MKYSKANHLLGIRFGNPNNGKTSVIPSSRIIQITKEKFNLLRYFDETQNKEPTTEKKISIANPDVFANLSIKGGKYADANSADDSGLFKKLAYPVM